MKTLITLLAAGLVFGFAYICYLITRMPDDIQKELDKEQEEEPWEQK